MRDDNDHPFDQAASDAQNKILLGFTVYQKFTCAGCGQRLTMADANVFHTKGTCDKCDTVTDIKKQGCNYLATIGVEP